MEFPGTSGKFLRKESLFAPGSRKNVGSQEDETLSQNWNSPLLPNVLEREIQSTKSIFSFWGSERTKRLETTPEIHDKRGSGKMTKSERCV